MAGPLAGIRVLDLSRVLAGPWAGQNLADLGAEVIKVERPKIGDDSRAFGPPWIKDREGRDTKDSAYFTSANRGKKSVTVNLQAAEGAALVRELALKSDVLIENYKFGDLERYGLAYAQLKDEHPRLVYCSVTGFGHTGPYRERPGYDFMIQGMGGMMSVTGEPGGEPQRAGVPIADIITGMYASIAICAALAHRAQSGRGQHLDLALLDSQIALLAYQNTNYFATGKPPRRIGNLHPNIVPYQPFRCADGEVILACGNDNLYRKFCEAAGCPELAADARFATNGKRVENRDELKRLLDAIFARRTKKEWGELLDAAGAI
jgi:crotonobetainyl-CoA:carnitine CoA-transferase CaiB-like acyl-CoA transferase